MHLPIAGDCKLSLQHWFVRKLIYWVKFYF